MRHRSDREFSRRGEKPTAYETALLAEAAAHPTVESVWVLIGARIGVEALAVVFDELAGEKIFVPPRAAFFGSLYEPRRNTRIAELRAQGISTAQIARAFGITPQGVNKILRNMKGPTVSAACAKRAAP